MDFVGKAPKKNPWESANPISLFLFTWVIPLFKQGFSNELTIDDLYDIPKVLESEYGAKKLLSSWNATKSTAENNGSKPRLWKALLRVHYSAILIFLAVIGIDELIIRVLQPIYLRQLIKSFQEDSEVTLENQMLYAGIVCFCSLFHDLVSHQCVYLMFRTGLSCRTASSSLIFRKAMRLRSFGSSEEATVGYLLNLLSNDVSRFDLNLIFLPYVIIGPSQFLILLYFLYDEIGASAFAGAGFLILIMPAQVLNGRLAAKFRESVAKQTDARSRTMNEIVMAIRVIKMYAWEIPFQKILEGIRRLEVTELGKRSYLRGGFLSLYTFSTRLTAFFAIMTYVLLGNEITADKAFFAVAISLTMVETMVFYFSLAMSGLGECIISMLRIERFLLLEEQSQDDETDINRNSESTSLNGLLNGKMGDNSSPLEEKGDDNSFPRGISLSLNNVTASWPGAEKANLRNLTVDIRGPQLVMIVGAVGSGKTTFLHLLLSELAMTEGNMKLQGDGLSYAGQEPWIFPGNIKQNILFGDSFHQKHYEEVVSACALQDDFNQLPNGDLTIVGERGITLSGGQKARVNLARALYRNRDVNGTFYLMDDPLSAVDTRVSRQIFDKGIQGFLRNKLRILVTHQLQYLPQADYVILLKNGEIHAQGSYASMVEKGVDFVSIMSSDGNIDPNKRKLSIAKPPGDEPSDELQEFSKPEDNIEKMAEGSVTLRTYWGYIKTAKSPIWLITIILMFISGQILLTSCEFWLSYWTDSEELHNSEKSISSSSLQFKSNVSEPLLQPDTINEKAIQVFDPSDFLGQDVYLKIYSALVFSLFAMTLLKAVGFFGYCLRISNNLHKMMFKSVVRAPSKFFDDNPSGRVLNRFTKDIGSIDELLPVALYDTLEYTLQMLGVVVVIIISNYFLAIPTLLIAIVFWILRVVFIRTSRDVKRLESMWKSPVFTHLASSIQGLTTIRALGAQKQVIEQFDAKQDIHSSAYFCFISTSRTFGVFAETVGIIFLTIVSFSFLLFSDDSSGGMVGLVITSTLALSVNIQWAIRQSAEAENQMTSVERALEYTKLTPEASLESSPEKKPPSQWPNNGSIQFINMSLSYDEKYVLKNLNFSIKSKEKCGIVGRTGAGKSSIISALFRLTEPKGQILIDGINISEIGLHDLRKNISIIPQDPVLFSGSIRYNLDPFNQFKDNELWEVLEEVQLKSSVPALDHKVSDGGSNFSVGQRQLVCLARAILRRNRIIVLDEATANVDPRTDEFIQKTIRQKFHDCSIITIAHRLHSVMDCDRILLLEAGHLMEHDHPHVLLEKENGMLAKMASHTGQTELAKLKEIARKHFLLQKDKNT